MARPKGTTKAKKPIRQDDYYKLIKFVQYSKHLQQQRAKVKLKRLFTLLYVTGCRISEVCELKTSDLKQMIQQKEYSLTNNTKTKQSRLIVFSDKQLEILKTIIPPEEIRLFDVSGEYLNIKANKVIQACLGELYSTHSFRAGYITRLAENGANIKLIQEDIGHRKVATTLNYIKVEDDLKRSAKESLKW
jgi:integrase/recombinase XerC/integrase/recombinase XerD